MNNGFISLHRKLLDNPIADRPAYAWLWVTLLLLANHEEHEFIFNGDVEKISRGQLVTGRFKLAKMTGIKPSTVEDILKYLENQQMIRQQSNSKFRIITIIKYGDYQNPDRKSNSKATASRQPADTYNNDNNVNNDNKNISTPLQEYLKLFNELFGNNFQETAGRKNKLSLRLKKFTLEQILLATTNLSKSKFHKGDNDRGWKADPDFLIRNDEQIDKWLNAGQKTKPIKPAVEAPKYVEIDDATRAKNLEKIKEMREKIVQHTKGGEPIGATKSI